MSIDKFDEGGCCKETFSIQGFIWKAVAGGKGFLISYPIILTT